MINFNSFIDSLISIVFAIASIIFIFVVFLCIYFYFVDHPF